MLLWTVILLGTLFQLASGDDYSKQQLMKLTESRKKLNKDLILISGIFNDAQSSNASQLKQWCVKYEENSKEYILNVTEISDFINENNLQNYTFLNVEKLQQSLSLTLSRCNVTVRKINLLCNLDSLNLSNLRANNKSNVNDTKSTLKLSDIKEFAIPIKECILEKIDEHIQEIQSVKKYCKDNNVTKVCETSVLNISIWEELRSNISEDLRKLNNIVLVHSIVNYVQPILYILVFISGILGNTILLIVFLIHKKFRKPQNMIIFNLALADTLTMIINLPLTYAFEKIGAGYGDTIVLAQICYFSKYLCFGLTAFSTVALCLQRFSTTLKASNYIGFILRQSTNDSAKKAIAFIWLFAIAFAIPRGVHGEVYIYETYNEKKYKIAVRIVTTLELILLSIIPFLLITVLSWLTVCHFQERAKNIPSETSRLYKAYQLQVLSRSKKVIILTPLFFACTSLPYFFFYCLRNFFELDINSVPDTSLKTITTTLLFLSSSFNPIGLYLASGNFRRCIREMFGLGPRKDSFKYSQPKPRLSKCATSENDTLDTYL